MATSGQRWERHLRRHWPWYGVGAIVTWWWWHRPEKSGGALVTNPVTPAAVKPGTTQAFDASASGWGISIPQY